GAVSLAMAGILNQTFLGVRRYGPGLLTCAALWVKSHSRQEGGLLHGWFHFLWPAPSNRIPIPGERVSGRRFAVWRRKALRLPGKRRVHPSRPRPGKTLPP